MIILIYFTLFSVVLLFSYKKFHRVFNIVSVFTAIWCVFGALSNFGLYGVRKPSIFIHIYVWIFVSIVDVVVLLFATKRQCQMNSRNIVSIYSIRARKLQILAFLMIIPYLFKTIPLLITSRSLSAVRLQYFSGTIFPSVYQDLLFRSIPMALFNSLIIYYIYISFEMKEYKYLIRSLFFVLFITVMDGGRHALLLLLYSIILLWINREKDSSKNMVLEKYKRKMVWLAIIIVVIMVAVTITRGQQLIKNVLIYFSGSLSFLDYIIEHPNQFALNQPLYGYLTFAVVIEPFVLFLKVVGLTTLKVPSYEFNIYCQDFYNIGAGSEYIPFNANTSVLYYFLRDFGDIGIVIGALFFGFLIVLSYNKWKKGNHFWGLMFLYLGNALFNSIMTNRLVGSMPFLIFVGFYLITHKRIKLKNGGEN